MIDRIAGYLGVLWVRWANDPARSRRARWWDHGAVWNFYRAYGWWLIRVRDPHKRRRRLRDAVARRKEQQL